MNSLSWMIYAADVAGSISGALVGTSILSGMSAAGCVMGYLITSGSPTIWSWDDKAIKISEWRKMNGLFLKTAKITVIVCAISAFVASFIPSRDTVYAIAASESIEQVAKSRTGEKALAALDAWLDRQIKPPAEKR